ncbi:MAG: cysteine dioxygenase family protein [Planctomycetes bacterium]|nr:cysteine dioxygenase family protein [Planctomycetota bacterium]
MTTAVADLHLEEFIHEVRALRKRDWRLGPFFDLVQRLNLGADGLREHVFFRADSYARNLICLTPQFEMLALCWRPGQNSRIHDHMESFSCVRVMSGTLTNRIYVRRDDGFRPGYAEVAEVRADRVRPGEYANLDVGGIHMMENPADSKEDLVTLHFYAEPLREMNVFLPGEKKTDRVRLRYTLEDRI